MAITFSDRQYLRFHELQTYWKCTADDIRDVVISSQLKPSLYVDEECMVLQWCEDDSETASPGSLTLEPVMQHEGDAIESISGWMYLQEPWTTGPFSCCFHTISLLAHPPKELFGIGLLRFAREISLADVEASGAFMKTEILRFEQARRSAKESSGSTLVDEPSVKQKNSMLTIIGLLLSEATHENDWINENANRIKATSEKRNVSISLNTVKTFLKQVPDAVAGKKQ